MTCSRNHLAVRSSPLGKNMKRTCRSILVIAILFSYCTLLSIPFTSKVTNFKGITITFADECSGNCSLCGCAPERSASRVCCCWQKKLHSRPVKEKQTGDDCHKQNQIPSSVTSCRTLSGGCGKFAAGWGGKSLECIVEFSNFDTARYLAEKQYNTTLLDYSDWKEEPPDPPPETTLFS